MTTTASAKQISYIISLANRASGDRAAHLSQVAGVIGLSTSKASRGLSMAEASAIIDELKARVAA